MKDKYTKPIEDLREAIVGIILHHSASTDDGEPNHEEILRYHVENLEWNDIGYHAVAERIGEDYVVVDGREEGERGAHAPGYNEDHLGLCFVGNFEQTEPPHELLKKGAERIGQWMLDFDIHCKDVMPHSDVSNTKCPGKNFPVDRVLVMAKQNIIKQLEGREWEVRHWQRMLAMAGIDAGPVDNIMGDKTRSGLEEAHNKFDNTGEELTNDKLKDKIINVVKWRFTEEAEQVNFEAINSALECLQEEVGKLEQEYKDIDKGATLS